MGFEPQAFTPEQLKAAKDLFKQGTGFVLGVARLEQLPLSELPEVAFAGRSNVGKSSLINAVTAQKGLAKTSNTPGRTQQLNYFNLAGRLHLVDLPGYGYAKVSGKLRNLWQKNLEEYLLNRNTIVSLIQLIDSRHDIQQNDFQMVQWIKYNNLPFFVIATKVDQIPKSKISAVCQNFEKILEVPVFPFSKSNSFYNLKITEKIEELLTN